MIFKLCVIVSSMLCSGIVFSQPIEPTPDYKYVLRIQREIESQIGYYLDEPKTGNLKKVHLESTKYLLLSERNRKHKALSIQSENTLVLDWRDAGTTCRALVRADASARDHQRSNMCKRQ